MNITRVGNTSRLSFKSLMLLYIVKISIIIRAPMPRRVPVKNTLPITNKIHKTRNIFRAGLTFLCSIIIEKTNNDKPPPWTVARLFAIYSTI